MVSRVSTMKKEITESQCRETGKSKSAGGGGSFWFGSLPLRTSHAIFNPQLVCTSKWQCINHTPMHTHIHILISPCLLYLPGLSAKNRMATHPPAGTPTVFLSTGSTRLKLFGSSLGSKFPNPCPTTKKLNPWR
ncbi:recombinase activating protein 1 [Striga asiatica]|uniref:Recombinase activating protein 1 n=1 Tax=Striga asiatica TaxID=4170 RepID=A0A5A7QP95_STRAF|nr:recombinase activating protein 1 [Striga asiatica]